MIQRKNLATREGKVWDSNTVASKLMTQAYLSSPKYRGLTYLTPAPYGASSAADFAVLSEHG